MTNRSINLYGYVFLIASAAPSLPNALFLTYLTLFFAQQQNFLLSAVLFTSVAIAQIALNPLFSRLLRHVSVRVECYLLAITRLLTIGLSGIIITLITSARDPRVIIVTFVLFLVIWSLDFVIMSKSPVWAKSRYSISFSQSSSIINLVSRGTLAFSPILASQLIRGNFDMSVAALAIAFGFSALSPFYLKKMEGKVDDNSGEDVNPDTTSKFWSPWASWYVSFLFFANFSVASLSFVILTSQSTAFYDLPLYTILYVTFLVIQALIGFNFLKLPRTLTPFVSRMVFVLLSISVVLLGLTTSVAAAVSCVLMIGTCYSLLTPMLAQTVFGKLSGERFREYLASGKVAGRVASLASTWIAGLVISIGADYRTLIIFIGIGGCVISLAMRIFERKLSKCSGLRS